MTITETVCTSCGHTTRGSPSPFCPQCGDEKPWEEQAAFTFEEDALPIVFSHEVYQDHSELWRSFVGSHFGEQELLGTQIDGLPDEFPALQVCVVELWFRITSAFELEGPFLSEEAARGHAPTVNRGPEGARPITPYIYTRNGYRVFAAPVDGGLTMQAVDEWDDSGTPHGWGTILRVEEGEEIVVGFEDNES